MKVSYWYLLNGDNTGAWLSIPACSCIWRDLIALFGRLSPSVFRTFLDTDSSCSERPAHSKTRPDYSRSPLLYSRVPSEDHCPKAAVSGFRGRLFWSNRTVHQIRSRCWATLYGKPSHGPFRVTCAVATTVTVHLFFWYPAQNCAVLQK